MSKGLLLLLLAILFCLLIPLTHAASWSQAAQFTGYNTLSDHTQTFTNYFNVSYTQWRVTYTFQFDAQYSLGPSFALYVYNANGYIVAEKLATETIGDNTLNVQSGPGTFHVAVEATNIQLYVVTVKQNIDTTPEYSTAIVLIALIVATSLLIIGAKRKKAKK